MNNLKTATQKHMTLDDRISIEKGLDRQVLIQSFLNGNTVIQGHMFLSSSF